MLSLREAASRAVANVWFKNPFIILTAKKAKPLSKVSSDGIAMLNWLRHQHILNNMPATHESLCKQSIGDLRIIARCFKDYVIEEMRDYTREDLIRFIEGRQRDVHAFRPLPPLPFGSLPEIETASVGL